MRVPAPPGLYRVDREEPVLRGSRCAACGRVAYPAVAIGCDVCGAGEDRLEPADLAATGVVHSFATVHLHRGKPTAPFSVADVRLDDGPLIRGMVSAATPALRVGARVAATWAVTTVDDEANDVVEPAFVEAAT
jgi:uncharacterized OB-fold protein